jgi:hypothetical protein
MKLHEYSESIRTRDDFVKFVRDLRDDLIMNPDRWENPTLDRYLDALAAWDQDMDGFIDPAGERPTSIGDGLAACCWRLQATSEVKISYLCIQSNF